MARLTVNQPVVGARTASGDDAVKTVDSSIFAEIIGFGNMSLQNAGAVNISGGNIGNTTISNCNYSGDIITDGVLGGSGIWAGEVITGGIDGTGHISSTSSWMYMSSDAISEKLVWKQGMPFQMMYESGYGVSRIIVAEVNAVGKLIVNAPTEFDGHVGFYGTSPIAQITVAAPSTIVTVETAGGTYTSNEQTMLDNLKTDVTNLRAKLNDVVTDLKSYGIFG